MKLHDRIKLMIEGMPEGGSVLLPVGTLRSWLDDSAPGFEADLTVDDVAQFFNRSPITIRTWIRSGELQAYRFKGREYRITHAALEEYQAQQRGESSAAVRMIGLG